MSSSCERNVKAEVSRSGKEPTIQEAEIKEDTSFSSGTEDYLFEKVEPTIKVTEWLTKNEKDFRFSTTDTESFDLSQFSGSLVSVFAPIPEEESDEVDEMIIRCNGTEQMKNDSDDAVPEKNKADTKKKEHNIIIVRNAETSERTSNITEAQQNEATRSEPSLGSVWFASIRTFIMKIPDDIRNSFNWNDFLYSFTFGFLPTAWDVYTDISLGTKLQAQEDVYSAGLCWMFVCLPPCFLIIENLTKEKRSTCVQLMALGLGLCFTATCAFLINWHPWVFFYPAVCLCLILLGGKILAVFIHTPEMKQFSTHLSHVECSFEASCQLLLILAIWLSGGQMHIASMASSVVVIGKVSAENYLMAEPKNLLAGTSFTKRIALTLRFMPVFSLTAFFRCGAGVVNVLNYNNFTPFSPPFVVFLLYCYIVTYYFWFMLMGYMLKLVMSDLQQLTAVELSYSLVGECSTITMWGRLGRRGSRRLQLAMNTYYFVSRYWLTKIITNK